MSSTPTTRSDSIVSAARTTLGDSLRSVITFTPSVYEVVYVRRDLADDPTGRQMRSEFVDIERFGFASQGQFNRLSEEYGTEPEIGAYVATIRTFTNGFVARVIVGDRGVIVTTDELDIASFEDLAATLRTVLAGE